MSDHFSIVSGVSAVAIDGRAILIEGKPGSGKSSLALAIIDRGAMLIGDDGIRIDTSGNRSIALPPPNIAGKLEIRGVGIVELPTGSAPIALILDLDGSPERLPDTLVMRTMGNVAIPVLPFDAKAPNAALRAQWALKLHGVAF
ncbi:HPr kinase / phosphorylase [Altererythrobacter epoxidivorans]|uniref:HPr kinase / phosphorylase n=1 Tax=Altererythrobacter epoxidivorans TaxID=361183 RepID=A0A0M5L732_9SPHN|nr:serine kinase [Altererythrobacter epoxidivorans]ALE17069.1 HPr kinase / phosphorylase [Altererythrobacter epoxidivorans]